MIFQLFIILAAFVCLYLILKPPSSIHDEEPMRSEVILPVKQDANLPRSLSLSLIEEETRLGRER